MGERTSYAPGTFSWTDLSIPDQAAAATFYSGLFGWGLEELPMGEGAIYLMANLGGARVAAISPQPQQQREAGAPPSWNSYISVESADESAARAGEVGGTVHAGPFDVFEAGRMAIVQDPQGAFFAIWEARENIGAGRVNEHGALCWNELYSPDIEASARFYGDLFGWTTAAMEGAPMPYQVVSTAAGSSNGGITTMEGVPPHWLVYFGTDDIDASVAQAGELGGQTVNGPMDIGVGKVAVMRDPQGAMFALYAGRFDD